MFIYIFIITISIFFGTANHLIHIPLLIILYPASLFLIARKSLRAGQAFLYGFLGGMLGISITLYWIIIPVYKFAHFPLWFSFIVPVLVGAYIALYGAFFSYTMFKAKVLPCLAQIIFAFLCWYMLEWMRSWFLTGFTWLNIASGNAAFPWLVQGVSIIGATGLSAFYALIACAMVYPKKNMRFMGFALLFILIVFGFYRTSQPILADNYSNFLIVQGNSLQEEKYHWNKKIQEKTFQKYLSLTLKGLEKAHKQNEDIDFIIYPETSMPFYLQDQENYRKQFIALANKYKTTLLLGNVSYKIRGNKKFVYNSLFSIKPAMANILFNGKNDIYSKQHLVPFGEYLPDFVDFEMFKPHLLGRDEITPGSSNMPLLLNVDGETFPIGILICYEAIFTDLAQKQVENNAQVFVNVSNDAWAEKSSALRQHFELSILRAVEQNRFIARATNTGISAVIDPYGQITDMLPLHEEAVKSVKIGYINEKTIYNMIYHYLTPIISVLFSIFLCIIYIYRRKIS